MPRPTPMLSESPIRFGLFEVDLKSRELRKRGIKIRLQQQPFEVLSALLERPGQLVTREQLQARIWAGNTFVDFDRGLNKAINRVREALGDLAATPRFIETQSKRGYRFIAAIGVNDAHSSQHLLRSSLLPPPSTSFLSNHFALSQDGSRLAFIAADSHGEETLWVRDLSASTAQRLANTEGARMPFWRPDGRSVGFFAAGKLKTIEISGGAVRILCDARVGLGGAWNFDDVIVFAPQVAGPLYRVAASGGTPVQATPVPNEQSSQQHCWPVFPSKSDRFLFFVNRSGPDDLLRNGIYAGSLTSTDVHLISSEIVGNVGLASNHLFFVAEGGLKAQAFDSAQAQLTGPVIPIVQHELLCGDRAWFHQAFSVSDPGTVVFQSRMDFAPEMVWVNMDGDEETLIRGGYWGTAVSPDGRFVAVSSEEIHDGKQYICVHDIERGVTSRLTDGGHEWHPSWSPDGNNVIYDSTEGYTSCTYSIPSDASGSPQLILEPGSIAAHMSSDGALVCSRLDRGWPHLEVRQPNCTHATMIGPGVEPQFSPDGKWLAYTEPGGSGIAVRPFPALQPRLKISAERGAQPRWNRDGTKLFYMAPDKKLMVVRFDPNSGRASAPTIVLQTRILRAAIAGFQFDLAPDGRFLINSLPAGPLPLTLLAGCNSLFKIPPK
jgi:DNA-binding winged helix-turn-helix (wHTH) protein